MVAAPAKLVATTWRAAVLTFWPRGGRPYNDRVLGQQVRAYVELLNRAAEGQRPNAFTFVQYDHFDWDLAWVLVRGARYSRSTGVLVHTWNAFWIERCSGDVYAGSDKPDEKLCRITNVYGAPGAPR